MAKDLKEKLEKMMDVKINEVIEEEDLIRVDIDEDLIGKAIGPGGSNVRATEKVIGKEIEVIKEDEE